MGKERNLKESGLEQNREANLLDAILGSVLHYVRSEENVSYKYTRQSPGLEATLNQHLFNLLWNKWGPFDWDLMASAATAKKNPQGKRLFYFSRYFEETSAGIDLFAQNLIWIKNAYCFPPIQ